MGSEIDELRRQARVILEAATALLQRLDELDERVPAVAGQRTSDGAEAPAGGAEADAEGVRLVALGMALSGAPREETEGYLAKHFGPADRERLLDQVYSA